MGTPGGFPSPPATGSGEQSSPSPTRSLREDLLELEQLEIDGLAHADHVGERRGAHLAANEPDQAAVLAAIQALGRRRRQPGRQQAIEGPRLAAALNVAESG